MLFSYKNYFQINGYLGKHPPQYLTHRRTFEFYIFLFSPFQTVDIISDLTTDSQALRIVLPRMNASEKA